MKNYTLILLFCLFLGTIDAQLLAPVKSAGNEVSIGNISGTLTLPNGTLPAPVVLIIAGSGPTDRDGNSAMGIKTDAYKLVAESFAKEGIATLRYDKRGIAKSKAAMTQEADLRFDTYIDDAVAWIAWLKADRRFSKVIVLGHSEGSLIGMIAARRANAAGFISVAGAGRSADKILQEQLKGKLPPQLLAESNTVLDSLRVGKRVAKVSASLAAIYRPSVQPYMISWMKYDPAKEISALKIPVLILQGTTDIQVPVEDAKLLSAAKPNAKLTIIPRMNHILKEADSDLQKNTATYTQPELPLIKGLSEEMIGFIRSINSKAAIR